MTAWSGAKITFLTFCDIELSVTKIIITTFLASDCSISSIPTSWSALPPFITIAVGLKDFSSLFVDLLFYLAYVSSITNFNFPGFGIQAVFCISATIRTHVALSTYEKLHKDNFSLRPSIYDVIKVRRGRAHIFLVFLVWLIWSLIIRTSLGGSKCLWNSLR